MTVPDSNTPDPLREVPPADRFCDVVLNGGVASGVVYPWALLKLARHYRFKNIGGNSVGAMAAALGAAAEYGRCHGVEDAFEPLRRMPLALAEVEEGGGSTKMLRLFQPSHSVRRLFDLFLAVVHWSDRESGQTGASGWALLGVVLRLYGASLPLFVLLVLAGWVTWQVRNAGGGALPAPVPALLLGLLGAVVAVLIAGLIAALEFAHDLAAMARNGYGLCTGGGQVKGEEGLVEWLHKGIQLSAGRGRDDRPLSFADLWAAPRFGQRGPAPLQGGKQPLEPGINLQMFASNVTQGRPVRLPLNDDNTRLYYHPEEWKAYFPPSVMAALEQASIPYGPASASDPVPAKVKDLKQKRLMAELRELPSGDMPIVVAARLSLCFPLLFSCVSVYAVDYEAPQNEGKQRKLRRCLLSDGGLCTNFPIHLFDAAHPRWPTFALLLDKRLRNYEEQDVWLPPTHLQGRADNWQRFVPGAEDDDKPERSLLRRLLGLAGGIVLTAKDWNDRVSGRLPQVRNRVIRLALRDGEGQLNLAMPRETILRMAHKYGTEAGCELVKAYAPDEAGTKRAWREHVYIRSLIELRALHRHLRGYTQSVNVSGSTEPLGKLLDKVPPLAAAHPGTTDSHNPKLTDEQHRAIERAVRAVQTLEAELAACEPQLGPYEPLPEPELRLRPPV